MRARWKTSIVDALKPEPIMSCVNEYFDCLTENGISISKERLPKNKLSVFISGRQLTLITQAAGICVGSSYEKLSPCDGGVKSYGNMTTSA